VAGMVAVSSPGLNLKRSRPAGSAELVQGVRLTLTPSLLSILLAKTRRQKIKVSDALAGGDVSLLSALGPPSLRRCGALTTS
jgi:hypothetical protein